MLEASVSPTTRLANRAPLAWRDETHIQTTEDLSVPNSDGLVIRKVCKQQMHLSLCTRRNVGQGMLGARQLAFDFLAINELQTMH